MVLVVCTLWHIKLKPNMLWPELIQDTYISTIFPKFFLVLLSHILYIPCALYFLGLILVGLIKYLWVLIVLAGILNVSRCLWNLLFLFDWKVAIGRCVKRKSADITKLLFSHLLFLIMAHLILALPDVWQWILPYH